MAGDKARRISFTVKAKPREGMEKPKRKRVSFIARGNISLRDIKKAVKRAPPDRVAAPPNPPIP